jgi:integrase/recombinase XerD
MSVNIQERTNKTGSISLYLDCHIRGRRWREFFPERIAKGATTREATSIRMRAVVWRDQRNIELMNEATGIVTRSNVRLLDYIHQYYDEYTKTDKRKIAAMQGYLVAFLTKKRLQHLMLSDMIDLQAEDFGEYLKTVGLRGETPSIYFKMFKRILKRAYKQKLLPFRPDDLEVKFQFDKQVKKEVLSLSEIHLLSNTPCQNQDLRDAFILCLNTGMDLSTVRLLSREHLRDGYIRFERSKTDKLNRSIALSNVAREIVDRYMYRGKNILFDLPTSNGCNATLGAWVQRAGIDKHITWHCARHSLAMILLNDKDTDIATVSAILGHSDLKTTQRYAHALDSLKEAAIARLNLI